MAGRLEDLETKLSSAPPITLENVLDVVRNVKSWRALGQQMCYSSELDDIQHRHVSDEACLKVLVEVFLDGKGRYEQPSWRAVIWCLYMANEIQLAEHIRNFAEPVQEPTLTVANVMAVMETVAVERRKRLWSSEDIVPDSQIYQKYSTEQQRIHACADTYINCRPDSSWTDLCWRLYNEKELTAARKAKIFIPQTDPTLTVDNVSEVMMKATDAMKVWRRLIRDSVLEDINSKCSTERELTHTCADIYVNCDPNSNWEVVALTLYSKEETAALEEVRSYVNPRDLTLTTERLVELFASMSDGDVDGMGAYLGTPSSKMKKFKMNYKDPAQRKEAYLDYYVHNHPVASWTKVANVLNGCGLRQQAAVVENTYIQVSEKTRLNFEAAMKDGNLWIRNGSMFFLGAGGSGKTHTLHIILEEDPPVIRDSTACAEKPIRAVAQFKVGVRGTVHFIRISEDQYSEMLANSAEYFSAVPKSVAPVKASQSLSTKTAAMLPLTSAVQLLESPSSSGAAEIEESSVQNLLQVPTFGFRRELQCRMQAKSKTVEQLDDKDLMDIKDSAGQPMFHEVLPAFVTNTMFGVLTVKLNESLDSYPLVEYYISGNRLGEPFRSPFTHLQTFRHCLKVLQSTCDPDSCPKIVFVGTHKDLEHECQDEDRKEKERKLHSIIPPEMKEHIIYNGEALLFAINAKTPGNDDRNLMGKLRLLMIKKLQEIPKKMVPLRYFCLENAFQRLAKYQRRAILSIDECLKAAAAYHFTTRESVDDVLQYLHSLKLIMYFKDILPDVVFIDAQVVLDKITELVEYSIALRAKPSSQSVAAGSLEKFKTCGIVTTEILSQFSCGYVPGVFEKKHLSLLFKKLLIVAEIGKDKFLMPCILEVEKVQSLCNPKPAVPALLFYFGENGPKLGVYCFLVASLITNAKWNLFTDDGNSVQLSRNRVRFAIPGNNPGCITITDSFSTFLHVSIEFPEEVSSARALEISEGVCPIIRETILANICKASQKLNYTKSIPEAAFLCSKHATTAALHPAVISHSTGLLTCTTNPASVFSELTHEHRLWLGETTSSDMCSSIPADSGKLSIKDLCKVLRAAWDAREKWYNVGLQLGIDTETLDTIKGNNDIIDNRFRAMLTIWLKMIEPRPTWEALTEALQSPTIGYGHLTEHCIMPSIKKARLSV